MSKPNQESSKVRVLCSQLSDKIGEGVMIQGWVHRTRYLGALAFAQVRDRSGLVQCVLEGKLVKTRLELESVVTVKGKVVASLKTTGGIEIQAEEIFVLNRAETPLPFEVNRKELGIKLETILEHRVLSMRNPRVHAIFAIQAAIVTAFREYLNGLGFMQIFTPKLVAAGTEGGSNLFEVSYFEKKAYLAQSPQFYKQMMVGAGYERVYEIAPVYRAEEHHTSRHLNEYISLDVEVGFVESEAELMELEEDLLRFVVGKLGKMCEQELTLLGVSLPQVTTIPRITVEEARTILLKEYGKTSPEGDLDPEGERLICRHFAEKEGAGMAFITGYPVEIRPMYAMPTSDHPGLTASFDLLFNGVEITTGGLRIHDRNQLEQSMRSHGLQPDHFASYLELFRYGMPPHGGFAIGLERLVSRLLNLNNVREASAFPRDRSRLTP
nr:aspartate--tRNA(Asn) ligase [Paenibacillus sp. CAA11]